MTWRQHYHIYEGTVIHVYIQTIEGTLKHLKTSEILQSAACTDAISFLHDILVFNKVRTHNKLHIID